jgi:Zn-dependent protease
MSWKIGRVAGIDLYLHPTFVFVLAYGASIGGLQGLLLVTAVFGCVLLHEFGHALTAQLYGIPTEDITLYPIGGVARLRRMPKKPGAELLIALAGPAVNLAIAGVLTGLMALVGAGGSGSMMYGDWPTFDALAFHLTSTLVVVNLALAAFNMIPAFPMDGGRVFRALLSGWVGRLRATEIAAGLGQILAVAFGVWSFVHFDFIRVFLAAFIYLAAKAELRNVRDESMRDDFHGDNGVWTAPPGYHWVDTGNGVWRLAPVWAVSSGEIPTRRYWS